MFQVIQKSKTDAKTRIWKNDLYKQCWEEVYKDIDTYNSKMQSRNELTEVIPKFFLRNMGTFKTLDIANTVLEKCNHVFPNMEHEIIEK